jgi:neutral ceramidase
MKRIKAGAAQVDITPPLGTIINGDFINHYARSIHDCLYAKSLVLECHGVTMAICVVDICAMKRSLLDEVKLQVQLATGIPPANILISSTHTHAAGSVESLLLGAADLSYRQQLSAKLVQSIVAAYLLLADASIAFGAVDAPEYVLCRRYQMKEGYLAQNPVTGELDQVKTNPFGVEDEIISPTSKPDTQLCYIAVKNNKDEWLSILANYSLHYVGDWENGTISADYFGEFSRALANKLNAPKSFVVMMSNGTSGEINIWDFLNPGKFPKENFKKSALIGDALAEKVFLSLGNLEWQTKSTLVAGQQDLAINIRKPMPTALATAKQLASSIIFEELDKIDFESMKYLYAREQILLHELPDTTEFPIQAFKIGNIVIGALGGEFFAETGLALKKDLAGFNYFTITLANDYVGYVCPEHEIEKGGYETWLCRSSCLDIKAEHTVRTGLLSLIRNL